MKEKKGDKDVERFLEAAIDNNLAVTFFFQEKNHNSSTALLPFQSLYMCILFPFLFQ
jgi:hypothetical protein